jgi:hypothetical protein
MHPVQEVHSRIVRIVVDNVSRHRLKDGVQPVKLSTLRSTCQGRL